VFAGRAIVLGMESTQKAMATTEGTRSSRIVERLLGGRHSLPLSIALHLVPGVLIVAVYLLFAEPLVKATGYPSFLGWAIAMALALAPVQLGLLLWLGRRRNGRFSLRGVLHYLDKPIRRGKLAAIVAGLIVQFVVVSFALTPLDNFVYRWLFSWVPFEGAGASATTYLDGYPHSVMVITLASCIPLTGLSFPVIEELYFRGFLLPRLSWLGRWAPVVNSALFSLYHLWSPWVFLSRLVFMLPGIWLVWRTKDLRVSIGMHAGTTLLLQTLGTIALLLHLIPSHPDGEGRRSHQRRSSLAGGTLGGQSMHHGWRPVAGNDLEVTVARVEQLSHLHAGTAANIEQVAARTRAQDLIDHVQPRLEVPCRATRRRSTPRPSRRTEQSPRCSETCGQPGRHGFARSPSPSSTPCTAVPGKTYEDAAESLTGVYELTAFWMRVVSCFSTVGVSSVRA
jgi:hypothetical protein